METWEYTHLNPGTRNHLEVVLDNWKRRPVNIIETTTFDGKRFVTFE
jgi:hypothetical protein